MNLSAATLLLASIASAAAKNPFVFRSKNNAKARFNSKLLSKSRRLNDEAEEVEVDLTGYSVMFEKCQFVKAYSDDLAEDEDSETVLATTRFIIFKLCAGSDCGSCNYNYGEYMVDLDEYLAAMIEYQQELQEEMCNACDENCQADEEEEEGDEDEDEDDENEDEDDEDRRRKLVDYDCDTCVNECDFYENMNDNGYYDAADFLECAMIYDPEDDDGAALYAGPMCASNGEKIKIGVFSDEYCYNVEYGKSVTDYLVDGDGLTMQIYETTLQATYDSVCISCVQPEEEDENANDDANEDEDEDEEEQAAEVLELCEQIYQESAKCENAHGFSSGYENNADYYNQAENEDTVCDFIDSIKAGSYDSEGEISLYGANSSFSNGVKTTGGQKFFLVFFILGTVGLGAYAMMLHSKLTKGGKAGLSSQGGAMA